MTPLDSFRLQTFVAVARSGGFSRAARALSRPQSSVSEAISRLEAELGHKLFTRDARATSLTEEGRVLLEHAERILDEMQAVRARLDPHTGEPEGELTVGTTDTLACYLLPPAFAALRRRHPRIQLRLENRPSPAIALDVAERRIPVGVVSLPLPSLPRVGGRPQTERLRVEVVAPLEDVVICPRDHPLARRRSVTAGQLLAHPLLLLDRTTSSRAVLEAAFASLGRQPTVVMETRSVDVLKRLVELGFGVSVVPSMAVTPELRSRRLAVLALQGAGPPREVGLITHLKEPLPRAARAFVEVAKATLGNPRRTS